MPVAEDKTEKIETGSGRRRPLHPAPPPDPTPNPDASVHRDETPSQLLRQFVDDTIIIARSDKPEESLVKRHESNTHALANLLESGAEAARRLRSGRRANGGGSSMLATILVAASVGFGSGQFSGDDVTAAIVSRVEAADRRVEGTEKRLDDVTDTVDRLSLTLGKTIQWLGNEQYKACKNDQDIAKGLNWLAAQLPKRTTEDYVPIAVDCDETPYLPDDMYSLREKARAADTRP